MVFLSPLIRTTPATTCATTFLECDLAHIRWRRSVRSTRVGAYQCDCSGLSKGTIASRRCIRLLQVKLSGKSQRRVLVSARLQDVGGVEIHVLNLCRWLVEQSAEVTFASRFVQRRARPIVEELRRNSVAVVTTPFAEQGDRRSTLWATLFWGLQLGSDFDVIYTFDTTAFASVLMGRLKPEGYMLGARAGVPRLDPAILHPAAARVLDGFIVETAMQARAYQQLGIPVLAMPLMAQIEAVPKRKLRPVPARLKIIFLGRLDPNKGIYRLLEFWPKAQVQPACLEIYGDGPERDRLGLMIRDRGLSDTVIMKGAWFGAKQL